MGAHIEFRKAGPDRWGKIHPFHGESLGSVYFSAWTAAFQKRAYGSCWHDCVVYALDGEEFVGTPPWDSGVGAEEWYQPDWTLCAERARNLLERARETTDAYDLPKLPEFVRLVDLCATPENAALCWIRISY